MYKRQEQYVTWASDPINDLKEEYCTFVLDLAMGNGAAYLQPSGQFDIYLHCRGNLQKLISFTAVSYTHLDVYKRQESDGTEEEEPSEPDAGRERDAAPSPEN